MYRSLVHYATVAALLLPMFGLTVAAQQRKCSPPVPSTDDQFKPGDVWTYAARPEDSGSTLTILKVETLDKVGVIVHVRLNGLKIRRADGFVLESIQHMPFTRKALAASVLHKEKSGTVPDFTDGYTNWSAACGGVYTISIKEAVEADQLTLLQGSQNHQ